MAASIAVENLLFLTIATLFLAIAGYAWRDSKPFEIPKPLPNWFQRWLFVVLAAGIVLPFVAMLLWGVWWPHQVVVIVFTSYFVMLGLQIVSEIVMQKQYQSPLKGWQSHVCIYHIAFGSYIEGLN